MVQDAIAVKAAVPMLVLMYPARIQHSLMLSHRMRQASSVFVVRTVRSAEVPTHSVRIQNSSIRQARLPVVQDVIVRKVVFIPRMRISLTQYILSVPVKPVIEHRPAVPIRLLTIINRMTSILIRQPVRLTV